MLRLAVFEQCRCSGSDLHDGDWVVAIDGRREDGTVSDGQIDVSVDALSHSLDIRAGSEYIVLRRVVAPPRQFSPAHAKGAVPEISEALDQLCASWSDLERVVCAIDAAAAQFVATYCGVDAEALDAAARATGYDELAARVKALTSSLTAACRTTSALPSVH